MIKFFRHIRHSLIQKNQMGKYFKYAIGEILLVVIGILIALQINNWSDKSKLMEQEKVYLKQLLHDFMANKEGISYFKKAYEGELKHLDVILRHTGPNVEIPSDKIFDSIQNLNTPNVELLYATTETQTDLNLDLISNNNLKQTIKRFPITYKFYDGNERGLDELVIEQRKIHQQYIPLIINENKNYGQEFHPIDTVGFLRNKEFQNITVDRLWVTRTAINRLKSVEQHNDSIVKLIEIELSKHD
ncbi:MAG: hypothetical protein ED556_02050 [Winogradskyella sp.]|uniref:DUF6090 family protein n=1 Tax=Winogradskyella sp. TaxID=1883156 RepID=UPI000F41E456|nr:DUF6090 family protein [Winogradskyella sp.]RNC87995.1 MAG: hypothetical protein ED556_02050 [Winogradskyella sp.]